MSKPSTRTDFREFLFSASGAETNPAAVSPIELCDNLLVELDRLRVIKELLFAVDDRRDIAEIPNVSLLIGDIEARARKMLHLFLKSQRSYKRDRVESRRATALGREVRE